MRRFFVGFGLAGSLMLFSGGSSDAAEVYICKGPSSKKYHLTATCAGLTRCSTKVFKVSLDEARQMGRSLCGWED